MTDEQTSIEPLDFAQSVMDIINADGGIDDTDVTDTADAPVAADSTEPELVADEQGNLHGPDGKFVEKGEQAAADDVEEEEEEDDETDDTDPATAVTPEEWELNLDDPDIESFLAKYDGDLNKALRGAVEASKMVGRQGGELGELRLLEGKVQALQDMVAAKAEPAPAAQPYVNWNELIDDDPKQAAQVAMQHGNVDAMIAAVNAWADLGEPRDAFEAATFLNNVQRGYEMANLRHEFASKESAPTPGATADEEVAKVLTKHPDLEKFLPAIGEIAKERPLLKQAIESGSPHEAAMALEDLYLIVRSRDTDTSDAVKKVRVRASEESKKARADAAVVSASRGSAASGDQPTKVDSFLDAFDANLRSKGLMSDD